MDEFLNDDLDQYFNNHYDYEDPVHESTLSYAHSSQNSQIAKTKVISKTSQGRNKHAKRLKACLKAQKAKDHQSISSVSLDKKQKNKMAAKQSRDRKKLYIELMEYEQKSIQAELVNISKQIETTKSKIKSFQSGKKAGHNLLAESIVFTMQSLLEKKLQESIESNCPQEEQIEIILDSICFRMGAMGRERLQKQKECFKQILNFSLPPLHRYLFWAVSQNQNIFQHLLETETANSNSPFLAGSEDQTLKQQQVKDLEFSIKEKKSALMELIRRFDQQKQKMVAIMSKFDMEMAEIRDLLNPSQFGKLILKAGDRIYRREMNFQQGQLEQNDETLETSSQNNKVKIVKSDEKLA